MNSGKLISFSGLDGCGKSTLAESIARYVERHNIEVVRTSAISDHCTPICEAIGSILKDPDLPEPLPHDAEMALLVAARVITEENVIKPALAAGKVVISDRYRICASIYQKGADGNRIDPDLCKSRLQSFNIDNAADLDIILDIDPRKTHHPMEAASNRLENRPMEEWDEMRLLYQKAYLHTPNAVLIDASKSKREVYEAAKVWVDRLLFSFKGA